VAEPAQRVLTLRELNRTSLARQLLLERARVAVPAAVERLVGLQAQQARPPYIGLWTRVDGFARDDLARLIDDRTIVKATFQRGTLHLLTASDYLRFRASLQPVLTAALAEVLKARPGVSVDVPKLVAAAREFLHAAPRSFAEITTLLTRLEPGGDAGAMRYAVRTHLPMVQVPNDTRWSFPGNPRFALAADWFAATATNSARLGAQTAGRAETESRGAETASLSAEAAGAASPGAAEASPASADASRGAAAASRGAADASLGAADASRGSAGVGLERSAGPGVGDPAAPERLTELVKRYLAAFGPASAADMQTWSYLTNLQPMFDALRDELVSYRLEGGREVFDLPELPIVDGDTPAPVRFLPEFDNLLMAHQDRRRVVPNAYRSRVYLPGLRVAATVLIDGFVAGAWTTQRTRQLATLVITPFEALEKPVRAALQDEAERLLRFAEPGAHTFEVRIVE
jgi:hypothetical protein